MKLRIAGIVNDSIVDGPGFRLSIFTQGCPHHCAGCHNPQTHDFEGGYEIELDEIIRKMRDNPLLDGITLSGGEPFCQGKACTVLARAAHEMGLNVWAYSGYTYEQLLDGDENQRALLDETDVLVDGPFVLEKRSLELRFRGSANQRLVDVPASQGSGHTIILE